MSARRLRKTLAVPAAAVLAAPLALAAPPVAAETVDTGDLTVTYVESARWNTGYSGEITVHNASGADLTDWTLEFELPEGGRVHELWNATVEGTAEEGYTVTPPRWGAVVPAGGSYVFGFNGVHEGGNTHLLDCSINGANCAGTPSQGPEHDELSVAYFTQWGVKERDYHVRDLIDSGSADKLTHINYAFGNVGSDGECFMTNDPEDGDALADYGRAVPASESVDGAPDGPGQPLRGNFNQLRKLKELYPELVISISLGGWNWSEHFSDAALTPESRERMVSSCVDLYLRGDLPVIDGAGGEGAAYGIFDGIDLDWEWPGSEGNPHNTVRPEDRENFTALVREFREQLDALGEETGRHFELSSFMPAGAWRLDSGYELDEIMPDFDFITVQGYDYHGTWETTTNHQSNLLPDPNDPGEVISTLTNVEAYLERGVDPEKIVLGVPFYGQGWTGVEPGPAGDGLFQSASGPAPGLYADGTEDWKALKELSGFEVHRDDDLGTAWLYDGETFWTYDDEISMDQKTTWAMDNGLGGVMIWSIDGDDADGNLITAIDAALGR
ncbi:MULTISPECIES: glycosyl hydrolase family 18 protein [Nocardiopsis]|uniref:chitinase n=1 Tax=Nocardiopsis alba TaxID=53437 RepID=A0A7K2IVH7_9ACTN|nr:glycosyl hydrolase family 18 protein [Nocardiopsis sp. LDBS1602]MEC3894914.1 glycosyl hydrolase family 18 protein [Nocardiopsis sp. LDBS1602]MYR33961.1 glycoside hydrolase [Nocardiopsis alba]